jgi:hypothetical protein
MDSTYSSHLINQIQAPMGSMLDNAPYNPPSVETQLYSNASIDGLHTSNSPTHIFGIHSPFITEMRPAISELDITPLGSIRINDLTEPRSNASIFQCYEGPNHLPNVETNNSTTTSLTSPSLQNRRLECTLCNKSFSSPNYADVCFFSHLGMKPFPCYGVCGDGSW